MVSLRMKEHKTKEHNKKELETRITIRKKKA